MSLPSWLLDSPSESPSMSPRTIPPCPTPVAALSTHRSMFGGDGPAVFEEPNIPQYTPIVLPVEPTLRELLVQISGTNALETVHEIRLHVIARAVSLQRICIYMPYLRVLVLDGSCLTSLRDLGTRLCCLQVLRVARCGLDSLDGTNGLTSVEELYAENNKIDDVSSCVSLPKLSVLNLKNNALTDVMNPGFLMLCEEMKHLVLEGCPVTETPNYRDIVKSSLPILHSLDGVAFEGYEDDPKIAEVMLPSKPFPIPAGEVVPIAQPVSEYAYPVAHNFHVSSNTTTPAVSDCESSGSFTPIPVTKLKCKQNIDITPASYRRGRARPATTDGVPVTELSFKPSEMLRQRPHSAHPTSEHDHGIDNDTLLSQALQAIGNLETSQALCGNLASALRNRKQRHEAWRDPIRESLLRTKWEAMVKDNVSWLDTANITAPRIDDNYECNLFPVGDGPMVVSELSDEEERNSSDDDSYPARRKFNRKTTSVRNRESQRHDGIKTKLNPKLNSGKNYRKIKSRDQSPQSARDRECRFNEPEDNKDSCSNVAQSSQIPSLDLNASMLDNSSNSKHGKKTSPKSKICKMSQKL